VHGVADAARPLVADTFTKIWTRDSITDEQSALDALEKDMVALTDELTSLLQRVINASGRLHARAWDREVPQPKAAGNRVLAFVSRTIRALKPPVSIAKPEFNVVNSEAVGWARERSSELVTNISEERRAMIQEIIADGIEHGRKVSATAKILRDTVGLNARQGEALLNLQEQLEEQGLDQADIDDEVSTRAAEMTNSRAETIAQTETMAAANEGQKELWDQAVEQGWLTGSESKEWIYTPDGNACEDCEDLDGKTVPLNQEFEDGDPPLHPNCRCTLGIAVEAVE
jgi:SPP1 gp7 family putative phage head morphogenesis protein